MSEQRSAVDARSAVSPRVGRIVRASIFAVVFVVTLLATSALGGYGVRVDSNPPPGANAQVYGELSSEWRWQPEGAAYEHIYMRAPQTRLDWIPEGRGTRYRR